MTDNDNVDVSEVVILKGKSSMDKDKHIVVIIKMGSYLKYDSEAHDIVEYVSEVFITIKCPENIHKECMQFSVETPEALSDFLWNAVNQAIYGKYDVELIVEYSEDKGLRPCDVAYVVADSIFF